MGWPDSYVKERGRERDSFITLEKNDTFNNKLNTTMPRIKAMPIFWAYNAGKMVIILTRLGKKKKGSIQNNHGETWKISTSRCSFVIWL